MNVNFFMANKTTLAMSVCDIDRQRGREQPSEGHISTVNRKAFLVVRRFIVFHLFE